MNKVPHIPISDSTKKTTAFILLFLSYNKMANQQSNQQLKEIRATLDEKKVELMKATGSRDITIGLKETGGQLTNRLCIRFWVKKKIPIEEVPDAQLVPGKVDKAETDVVVDVEFEALKEAQDLGGKLMNEGTLRLRPIPMGASICNIKGTAGSTGFLYKIGDDPYLLSNAHVLAADPFVGVSEQEVRVVQPGPHHGGSVNGDHCGDMTKMLQLNDHSKGTVMRPESDTREREDGTTIQASYNTADAALMKQIVEVIGDIIDLPGMPKIPEGEIIPGDTIVSSSWRMNGVTKTIVTDIGKMGRVSYGNGRIALIADCIVVRKYGDPGTSGMAAIRESDGAAAGLNFAGSDTMNLICTIQNINKIFGGEVVCASDDQPPSPEILIDLGAITLVPTDNGNGTGPDLFTIIGGPFTNSKTGDPITPNPVIWMNHPEQGVSTAEWTGEVFHFKGVKRAFTHTYIRISAEGYMNKEVAIIFPPQQ